MSARNLTASARAFTVIVAVALVATAVAPLMFVAAQIVA